MSSVTGLVVFEKNADTAKYTSTAATPVPRSPTIQEVDFLTVDFATLKIKYANIANIAMTEIISHRLLDLISPSRTSLILNLNESADPTSALFGLLPASQSGSAFAGGFASAGG